MFGSNWLPVKQEARYYFEPEPAQNSHLVHEQRLMGRSFGSSFRPSFRPSFTPSYRPSFTPTYRPSFTPSYQPSFIPSYQPMYTPSYSSYSSPFGSSYTPYVAGGLIGTGAYTSYGRRQRERANEVTSIGLLISILQEIYLF